MKKSALYLQTSLILLITGLIFLSVLFISIPFSPSIRNHIITFIEKNHSFFTTCGFLLFIIAILLLIASYLSNKGLSFTVDMGKKGSYTVDRAFLNNLLNAYFKTIFTTYEVSGQFSHNQINIFLSMPPMPFIEQKPLLTRIERELADIFEEQFDYSAPFFLSTTIK